jgi:hypothetical protein
MPLGPFEREVLRLLATNRNPDSYVGGATVLHQTPDSPRSSEDIDLFHDAQGQPVCLNPGSPDFATLTRHFGSVKGAWPRIVDS